MTPHPVKLEYPNTEIPLVLRSTYKENTYYGVDQLERKKLKIVMRKFGCRRNFHSLPGRVIASLYPFVWDRLQQCYRIQLDKKVSVLLNTLEEAVVNHPIFEEG